MALAILLSGFVFSEDTHSEKRPNILFIIVDDQSPFDFNFYNSASTLHAPCIEQLAREGMVLMRRIIWVHFPARYVPRVAIW